MPLWSMNILTSWTACAWYVQKNSFCLEYTTECATALLSLSSLIKSSIYRENIPMIGIDSPPVKWEKNSHFHEIPWSEEERIHSAQFRWEKEGSPNLVKSWGSWRELISLKEIYEKLLIVFLSSFSLEKCTSPKMFYQSGKERCPQW